MKTYFAYDVRSIKEFIFGSLEFKGIIGASILVDRFDKAMRDSLKGLADCIYTGGGTGLFVLENSANKQKIEEEFLKTRNEHLLDHEVVFTFMEENEIKEASDLSKLDGLEKVEDFAKLYSKIAFKLNVEKEKFKQDGEKKLKNVCPLCGENEATELLERFREEEPIRICKLCKKKYDAATGLKTDIREYSESKEGQESDSEGTTRFLGVMYCDGNSLGNIYKKFQTADKYRSFSEKLDEFVKNWIELLKKEDGEYFAPILGGDDILVFSPPSKLLQAIEKFDKYLKENSEEIEEIANGTKLTFSIGAAVVPSTLPLKFIFDVVTDLQKEAKKQRYNSEDSSSSFIAFRYLNSFDLNPVYEEDYMKFGSGMKLNEFLELYNETKDYFKKGLRSSDIYKIYGAIRDEKDNLYGIKIAALYFLSRGESNLNKKELQDLIESILYFDRGQKVFTKFPLLLDLFSYLNDFCSASKEGDQ